MFIKKIMIVSDKIMEGQRQQKNQQHPSTEGGEGSDNADD
jgi:hypothetical protein